VPSHISLVEPLRPEWPSCRPIFAVVCWWTKRVIAAQWSEAERERERGCAGDQVRRPQPQGRLAEGVVDGQQVAVEVGGDLRRAGAA
jgi:hypothetical protein